MSRKVIDPAVLQAIAEHGFLLVPPDAHETRYVDEHGHVLSERQLLNESVESVTDLIRHLHHEEYEE